MRVSTSTDGRHPGAVTPGPPFSSLVRIDVDARSHPGHDCTNNEDHFLVSRLDRTLQTLITSLPAGAVPAHTGEVNSAADARIAVCRT
jgi:hypothetical protein